MKKTIKKLQLKKEIVAKLDRPQQEQVVGGRVPLTAYCTIRQGCYLTYGCTQTACYCD